jgi:hypothetical protein
MYNLKQKLLNFSLFSLVLILTSCVVELDAYEPIPVSGRITDTYGEGVQVTNRFRICLNATIRIQRTQKTHTVTDSCSDSLTSDQDGNYTTQIDDITVHIPDRMKDIQPGDKIDKIFSYELTVYGDFTNNNTSDELPFNIRPEIEQDTNGIISKISFNGANFTVSK